MFCTDGYRLNGQLITTFIELESVLDESVSQTVTIDVERGGAAKQLQLTPQDLHSITPDYFVEVGGGVFVCC